MSNYQRLKDDITNLIRTAEHQAESLNGALKTLHARMADLEKSIVADKLIGENLKEGDYVRPASGGTDKP